MERNYSDYPENALVIVQNAEAKETSASPPRTNHQREMFVPDMTNSNDFGGTYLQKQSSRLGASPQRKGKTMKLTKTDSPAQPPIKSHTNSQSNITSVAPTSVTYNISHVIAAQTSQQSLHVNQGPQIERSMRDLSKSQFDKQKS